MINKIKSTKRFEGLFSRKQYILSLIVFLISIDNICCESNNESDKNKDITTHSSPKIIKLQTYKDWSSRLGANQTTPESTSLIFEESKEVRTTDYGTTQKTLITSTEDTINNSFSDSLITTPKTENSTEQVNAHSIAAQVFSRILHISPLLALASNGVPYRLNYSRRGYDPNKRSKKVSSIESINEIEVDSDINNYKSDRMSASGISFPTTPSSTTVLDTLLSEPNPTEPPIGFIENPTNAEEEHDHNDSEEHEDDEPSASEPSEDHDDYEDDEELESFRYPVRVSFQDSDDGNDYNSNERESSPPFVMPNLNLNPEALKQKGCRTVVKEVQAIPVINGLQKQNIQKPNLISRIKRNSDDNSRKFTSIIMTKECHFPGDEGASSEENPQTVTTAASSDPKGDQTFQAPVPTPPSFDDYDEDFDFRSQYPYPSSDLIDRMETKPSNDRRSYADNPLFRRDNSDDFNFDDSNFYDFDVENQQKNKKKNKMKNRLKNNKKKPKMSSSPTSSLDFDDEDFGPQPKPKSKQRRQKRPQLQSSEGRSRQRNGRKKPKKINRSFAFFRKAEPKDKDPNESDYSVSYGRGNFQSFSEDYDSDRDGPRGSKGGKGGKRGKGGTSSGRIRIRSKSPKDYD